MGSASRINCITSSMDHEEGFLPLGILGDSHSAAGVSGPVVELAAAGKNEQQIRMIIIVADKIIQIGNISMDILRECVGLKKKNSINKSRNYSRTKLTCPFCSGVFIAHDFRSNYK